MHTHERRTVALIGAGGIANAHLPVWAELGYEILVFALGDDARRLTERHGAGTVASSLDDALDRADVVDICTPTTTHYDLAMAALARRLPTICEKPLTRTAGEAERLVEAFEAARVPLFPAHVVRYFPEYAALHSIVARGDLGKVGVQRYNRQGGSPQGGWYLDDALSGGVLLDLMIHDLDIARWIGGEVDRVFARSHVVGRSQTTQAFLTHRGGAISTLTASWTTAPVEFRTSFDVAGSDGVVRNDSHERRTFSYVGDHPAEVDILPPYDPVTSPYRAEIRDFLDALATGRPTRVTARDGLAAVRVASAIATSIETGRTIELASHAERSAA